MSAGVASDAALDALFVPFAQGDLRMPADGRVAVLRAHDGFALREWRRPGWVVQQSFKPAADALARSGFHVEAELRDGPFPRVLVLPTRQREETRALFAHAARLAGRGGVVVASVANDQGARSAAQDFERLMGATGQLSKHKCRVFWAEAGAACDDALLAEWQALDQAVAIGYGLVSRRGLFAWDRIDAGSALLARHLPAGLRGRLADLGAGFGFLACAAIEQCPGITAVDLFEAEARALGPAETNVRAAAGRAGRGVIGAVHWHDVTQGVPGTYDVVLSNPPFHQGRADDPRLGRAFIDAAASALAPGGVFLMVANRHLPYEATLRERFARVHTCADEDGYKVIEAREPRA